MSTIDPDSITPIWCHECPFRAPCPHKAVRESVYLQKMEGSLINLNEYEAYQRALKFMRAAIRYCPLLVIIRRGGYRRWTPIVEKQPKEPDRESISNMGGRWSLREIADKFRERINRWRKTEAESEAE